MDLSWQSIILGHSIQEYVLLGGRMVLLAVIVAFLLRLLQRFFDRAQETSPSSAHKIAALLAQKSRRWLWVLMAEAALIYTTGHSYAFVWNSAIIVGFGAFALQIFTWVDAFAEYFTTTGNKTVNNRRKTGVRFFTALAKGFVAITIALMALGYFDIDTWSLVTGLGVGGIIAGLALQGILKDLFSGLALYFEEPFRVGDFVRAGTEEGTVTSIGWKTTRLRAVNGETIIIPNNDVMSQNIYNTGRLSRRRVLFKIGVHYDTTEAQLEAIPQIIEDVLAAVEETSFEYGL